uniref:F-box domain-containing protein n=1 Tax=Strongyloides stercoralis TaxID=6248 RepID=A0A0K0EK96_STRER
MAVENNELFLTIINQNHILKKFLSQITLKDCYNFSRSCRECYENIERIKQQGDIINFIDFYANCIVSSEKKIDISKVFPIDLFKVKHYDRDYIRRIKFKVEFEEGEYDYMEYTMYNLGKQLNNALFANPVLKELSLVFFPFENDVEDGMIYRPIFVEPFIGCLIKEIKNNSISTLSISNTEWMSDMRQLFYVSSNYSPYITNDNILDGLSNLKKIKINIQDLTITRFFKDLIDSATKIEGVIIEVDIQDLFFVDSFIFNDLNENECILTYILRKEVFLSITNKSIRSGLNLSVWFGTLNIMDLAYIRSLHMSIRLFDSLHQLSFYLKYMVNIEKLELRFDVNVQDGLHEGEDDDFWEPYVYSSFKNIKNLKTIKVKFVFEKSNLSEISYEYYCLIKSRLEGLLQKQLFSFFSKAPSTVKNLCFFDMPQLTNSMTFLLNVYFPNLKFLFIRRICEIEKECLLRLKNLKFYVSSNVDCLELPKNIQVCFVCGKEASLNDNNEERFGPYFHDLENIECYNYYKNSKIFLKETSFSCNLFVAKIFFNYLKSYHDIIWCLENINELIQMRNE